jgi:hypothetical protein
MRAVLIFARLLVGVAGIGVLVLGLLFWSGYAPTLGPTVIAIHKHLGEALVLGLWILGIQALFARVAPGLAVLVLVWGLAVPALGMMQMQLLPGEMHWVIQLTHLLVGVVALGLGHMLAARITASLRAPDVRVPA